MASIKVIGLFLNECLLYTVYQKVKNKLMTGSPGKININTYESKAGKMLKNENTEAHQKQRQYLKMILHIHGSHVF